MRGQSLLEVILALGIFAVGATAALLLVVNQSIIINRDQNTLRVANRAHEGLEAVRLIRNSDWLALTTGNHGLNLVNNTWEFQSGSDISYGLTRVINISDLDAQTKEVTSTVSWQPSTGPSRSVSLQTRLKDWRTLGQAELWGDWQNPITLGSVDLGPGVQANGIAVRNRIVYLAASASTSSRPDFFVVDTTNSTNPVIIGSLNTGPGTNDVAISGNYAYLANQDDDRNQLQIVDISNPASPRLISSFTPSGIGNDSEAWSVTASGNIVYLGLDRNSGREFQIIDATNPISPRQLGAYEVDSDILDIVVRNNLAFLGTERDDRELIILDVSASPIPVGRFDAPGGSEDTQGLDVDQDTGRTYLGRDVGGDHTDHHEFHIINTTNPTNPTNLGSIDIPHTVNAVQTVDYLTFLATTNPNREFQIYRVDNPASIELWGFLNFPQVATDLTFERNIVYVAIRSNDALRIITAQ